MDRKTFIRSTYSKYWLDARERIYGFMEYDKHLCRHVHENVSAGSRLLDVGVGTGYPFADFFQKQGYHVFGVDLSPLLVEKCKQLNREIACEVRDAEDLPFPENTFDCTYCFQSSWYFPNPKDAVREMVRVTRPMGFIIFDVQNRNHRKIDLAHRMSCFENSRVGYPFKCARNIYNLI